MADIVLYHNPKCGTSNKVKKALEDKGVEFRVVEYLKTPPSAEELEAILGGMQDPPQTLARKKEDFWKANDPAGFTAKQIAAKIAKNPVLMERPLVVRGKRAVVARPPEKLEKLF